MAFCRSCGAEIVWIRTAKGKAMPCDVKKIKGVRAKFGDTLLVTEAGTIERVDVRAPIGGVPSVEGYISHFATCQNAGTHRRKI